MDKPFRTRDELIEQLRDRGLTISKHTGFVLAREGYYPVVNGYKWPFLSHGETFIPGTSFDEIYALFVMDRHLRTTLFRFIVLAEAVLKSICSYQ